MNVEVEPAARAEIAEAVEWYIDVAGPAVADAFEREFNAVIQLLLRFPKIGSPGKRESRKLRLDGFPYTLHYRIDGESIRIVAVANQRRKPGYWRGR